MFLIDMIYKKIDEYDYDIEDALPRFSTYSQKLFENTCSSDFIR